MNDLTAMRGLEQRVQILTLENAELEERVRQLQQLLLPDDWAPPLEWGLTVKEAAIVGLLLRRKVCTKQYLMDAMYSLRATDEAPEQKIIDVFVCKVRKKLGAFGVEIKTLWGKGYYIEDEVRHKYMDVAA